MKGKKLIVRGENFTDETVIILNGEAQKTRTDPGDPTRMLTAKRAGNKVARDEIAMLKVRNSDGPPSAEFPFYTGRTITLFNLTRSIDLNVGDRFLIDFRGDGRTWVLSGMQQPRTIIEVVARQFISATQGLYEAEQTGEAILFFDGYYPFPPPPLLCPPAAVIRLPVQIAVE